MLNLSEEARNMLPASFDSFGMLAARHQAAGDRDTTWHFDDIAYSTMKEQPPIPENTWNADASISFAGGAGYLFPLPPSNTISTTFGDILTQSRVLFADAPTTFKDIIFDSANTYVLAGQGEIIMEDADDDTSLLNVVQGNHQLSIPLKLNDNVDLDVAAGSTLTLNGALDLNGFTLAKTGSGDLVINNIVQLNGGMITGSVINNVLSIPEPSSATLLVLVVLALTPKWRRRW